MNSSRNSFEMVCCSRFIILQSVVTRYLFVQKVVNCCNKNKVHGGTADSPLVNIRVVGNNNTVTASNALVLGNNSTVPATGGIAIGNSVKSGVG